MLSPPYPLFQIFYPFLSCFYDEIKPFSNISALPFYEVTKVTEIRNRLISENSVQQNCNVSKESLFPNESNELLIASRGVLGSRIRRDFSKT